MHRYLIVVVVYKIELNEALTLQRLVALAQQSSSFPEILVYDNSPTSKYNNSWTSLVTYYKHDAANSGVAGAYNYAVELASTLNKEFLILFDQDTNINDCYFNELQDKIDKYPQEHLFCPKVRSHGTIVSPAYYFAEKALRFREPKNGLQNSRNFTVINSGLAVRISELKALGGFDEELPLDFSDHYFFWKYKKRNRRFVIIDCENGHSLSAHSDVTFNVVYERFKKYSLATSTYSNKVGDFFPKVWLFTRALKLTVRFKSFSFLRLVFQKQV